MATGGPHKLNLATSSVTKSVSTHFTVHVHSSVECFASPSECCHVVESNPCLLVFFSYVRQLPPARLTNSTPFSYKRTCTTTHFAAAPRNSQNDRNLFDMFHYKTRSASKASEQQASMERERGFQIIDSITGQEHGVVEIHSVWSSSQMTSETKLSTVECTDVGSKSTGTTAFKSSVRMSSLDHGIR